MTEEAIQTSMKNNDLQKSKMILYKLIKHYSYNSIVDYLFNPNKITNPTFEYIMKKLISTMGIDTLAFLLSSENLNSININKEKEEKKTNIRPINELNNEKNKYKTFLIKKKYKNRILNREAKFNKNFVFHKYKYKNNKSKSINLDEDSSNSSIDNSSYNRDRDNDNESDNEKSSSVDSENSNNSEKSDDSYNKYCNDFNEFCESEINKENIINLVNKIEEESNEINKEEEEKEKEEKKEIQLDESNSYIYQIIYKVKKVELYYYTFDKFNDDNTITMNCIDELCKSKGIYNYTNKQIMIISEHSIPYEDHCYLKTNFGKNELDLEIFDFIKDNPDITGIEILKSKDNVNIKKEKDDDMNIEEKSENKNKYENINKNEEQNEEDNISSIKEKQDNKKSNNEIIKKRQPIYQNKICNKIKQIIKKQEIKEKEKNDNFTLFSFNNNNLNSNNIKTKKPNKINHNKEVKEINFIQKDDLKNSSIDTKNLTNDETNYYNFVEFNIDEIKKLEGTENSYSKEVYKINLENKKFIEEENKKINLKRRSHSKKGLEKLQEKINESENYNRIPSHSSSPSYLMNNENIDLEKENDTESIYSKLSVISHFNGKKIEEKIIIDENDSLFSFDYMNGREREKYNKRINDEIISISEDDSEKRKKLERLQRKIQERNLGKYLKKQEPHKRSIFRVNERKIREEDEVNNNENKRRIFGISRRSISPSNIKEEKIEEVRNEEKIDIKEDEIDNNKEKKRMPIFGIFNPNKHNPRFFVNNNFNKK